jgi:SM-20-related protein
MMMIALSDSASESARQRMDAAGRVLIRDVLDVSSAQQLTDTLLSGLDWELTTRFQGETRNVAHAKLHQMSAAQREQLRDAILRGAKQDFQFEFLEYSLRDANLEALGQQHVLVHLLNALRGDVGKALFCKLLGLEGIAHITAFVSRYEQGHFLMPHTDHVTGEQREAAFVLNLSPRWKPEWGGLLQFIGVHGDVTETFVPHHNTLSLFKVPQPHMVSFLTPLAESPRLAVAGWIYSALPKTNAARY